MKDMICLVGFLVLFLPCLQPVGAEMYKCTGSDGSIAFSDKPCPGQEQEILKIQTTPAATGTAPNAANTEEFPEFKPITPLAGGKKVLDSSPLAQVYLKFIGAVKQCDRNEMLKHVSRKMADGLNAASDKEFKDGCKTLEIFLPQDFKDATEVIEGDRGKIQWLSVTTEGEMTMRNEQTEDFVREDGAWKYGE